MPSIKDILFFFLGPQYVHQSLYSHTKLNSRFSRGLHKINSSRSQMFLTIYWKCHQALVIVCPVSNAAPAAGSSAHVLCGWIGKSLNGLISLFTRETRSTLAAAPPHRCQLNKMASQWYCHFNSYAYKYYWLLVKLLIQEDRVSLTEFWMSGRTLLYCKILPFA